MTLRFRAARRCAFLLTAFLLISCGGDSGKSNLSSSTQLSALEADAPAATGDVSVDGLIWFNFRRQQAGLSALRSNVLLERAAKAHADYQKTHNIVAHDEIPGAGFTGADASERMRAAGYSLNPSGYADGEVIAAISTQDGFAAAEGLMAAIYHRFVIMEPVFIEAGTGSATRPGGYTWLTTNFMANQTGAGLGAGRLITWPASQQQNVGTNFFSNQETPDPVALLDEVGYPVSVHADITAIVRVESFTIRVRGEPELPTRLLDGLGDQDTPHSAAAIIPLKPLRPATVFDVHFKGRINGASIQHSWSFATR